MQRLLQMGIRSGHLKRCAVLLEMELENSLSELCLREHQRKQTKKTLESFKVHYGIHCADHTKPYDGIIKLLEDLRKCGIQTAVVSNKADFAVQELCSQYFPKVFDFVVGEREGIRRKPCPDSVFEVLKTIEKDGGRGSLYWRFRCRCRYGKRSRYGWNFCKLGISRQRIFA